MAIDNVSKNYLEKLLRNDNNIELFNNNIEIIMKGQHANIAKIKCLVNQYKFIKRELEDVLINCNLNNFLNSVKMSSKKYVNNIYHLYKNKDKEYYLSIISPEEFNYKNKNQYFGSYKLENDFTWSIIKEI